MPQLLAAAFFWSLLAVPVGIGVAMCFKHIEQLSDDTAKPPCDMAKIGVFVVMCGVLLVSYGFIGDVLPRLYAVLMEVAK